MKKMKQTEFVAKQTCTIVADLLHAWGVEDVVLSPGSRNAPLIMSIVRSGRFRTHVVIDERSAAFIALGMSLASERPVLHCLIMLRLSPKLTTGVSRS